MQVETKRQPATLEPRSPAEQRAASVPVSSPVEPLPQITAGPCPTTEPTRRARLANRTAQQTRPLNPFTVIFMSGLAKPFRRAATRPRCLFTAEAGELFVSYSWAVREVSGARRPLAELMIICCAVKFLELSRLLAASAYRDSALRLRLPSPERLPVAS